MSAYHTKQEKITNDRKFTDQTTPNNKQDKMAGTKTTGDVVNPKNACGTAEKISNNEKNTR